MIQDVEPNTQPNTLSRYVRGVSAVDWMFHDALRRKGASEEQTGDRSFQELADCLCFPPSFLGREPKVDKTDHLFQKENRRAGRKHSSKFWLNFIHPSTSRKPALKAMRNEGISAGRNANAECLFAPSLMFLISTVRWINLKQYR